MATVTVKPAYGMRTTVANRGIVNDSGVVNFVYNSIEIPYIAFGAADEIEAINEVRKAISDYVEGVPLNSLEILSRDNDTTYHVNAIYQHSKSPTTTSTTMTFDCGGGTKHMNYAFDQESKISGAPDAGMSVGWNGKWGDDCQISGVDVPTAQLRETYTKYTSASNMTTSKKKQIAALVGKVNKSSFKGWEPGEVMFLGMSYSTADQTSGRIAITYNFMIQPNESGVKIGTHTVSKKGFQYIWSLSKTAVKNGKPELQIQGIYVSTVCESGDFSALGI